MITRFTICFSFLLSACSAPSIVLEKVDLLEKEQAFAFGIGKEETKVVGVLLAEISSNENLYEYAAGRYATKSFEAQTCDSGVDLVAWSEPIRTVGNDLERFYYRLLVNYKLDSFSTDGNKVNPFSLLNNPEDICINVFYGSMLNSVRSNVVKYQISTSLLQSMRDYEEESGEVYFK